VSVVEVSTLSSLFDLAVEVQTVAETALTPTIGGVPPLSYITPSEPAYDCCPALVVWISRLEEEATSPLSPPAAISHRASYGRINLVTFQVIVLRCAPVGRNGNPPPVEEQTATAEVTYQDGWALWTSFYRSIDSDVFRGLCREVYFDGGFPVDDQGGCVGWNFTIRTEIAGIIG
jgi:hypothetical protein